MATLDASSHFVFDLFLSYASADKVVKIRGKKIQVIEELKRQLEFHVHPNLHRRFRVCSYDEDFELNDNVNAAMRNRISQSKSFLVICSVASSQSQYVNAEIQTFAELRPDEQPLALKLNLIPAQASVIFESCV